MHCRIAGLCADYLRIYEQRFDVQVPSQPNYTIDYTFEDMSSYRDILLLLVLLSASIISTVLADHTGLISPDKGISGYSYATALTGGDGCSDEQLEKIRAGFMDMITLFQSSLPFEPNGQPAMEFFGAPTTQRNYSSMISGNLQRGANYGKAKDTEGKANSDVHVRCDDPMEICRFGNEIEGTHAAYNLGNEPHINFCDDYFELDNLKRRVDKIAGNQIEKDKLLEYYNQGTLWVRMVMHIAEVGKAVVVRATPGGPNATTEWVLNKSEGAMNTSVLAGVPNERPWTDGKSDIETLKYTYGVIRTKLLPILSTQMPYDAANNAESYAMYVQARHVVKEKGFYPSIPVMDFPNEGV